MYKQLKHPISNQIIGSVQRIADKAFIPFDPANTDYAEYLRWIEAGNTPLPADTQPE